MQAIHFVVILALLLIAIVLLCVRILLKKGGQFPNMHIGNNQNMRERGIGCTQSQDRNARKTNKNKIDITNL